jgi:hypothetical protein
MLMAPIPRHSPDKAADERFFSFSLQHFFQNIFTWWRKNIAGPHVLYPSVRNRSVLSK